MPYSDSVLTKRKFSRGIRELTERDAELAGSVSKWGDPPFWIHPAGFPGIVFAVLSQQVSLESARATATKLQAVLGTLDSKRFLALSDSALRLAGFSRQKTSYIQGIAREITAGKLVLEKLDGMDDEKARQRLMRVRGIGSWTADTYLLFSMRRSDVWPSGDLALELAVREITNSLVLRGSKEIDKFALRWSPWRAVAARILWHHYLRERGRAVPG